MIISFCYTGAAVIFSFMLALKLFNFLLAFDSHGKMQCSALTEKDDAESMERAYMIWRDRYFMRVYVASVDQNYQYDYLMNL